MDCSFKQVCVYILKGNSGRSMKPWQPQSGVWYASGWIMKWAFSPAFFTPSIISFTVFRHVSGSKWQLMPTMWAPERRHVDFHQQSNDQVEFWRIFVWQFVFRCILNLQPRALWASVVLRFFESTPFFPPIRLFIQDCPRVSCWSLQFIFKTFHAPRL